MVTDHRRGRVSYYNVLDRETPELAPSDPRYARLMNLQEMLKYISPAVVYEVAVISAEELPNRQDEWAAQGLVASQTTMIDFRIYRQMQPILR